MRLLYLLVAVPAILAIPSQVLALAPKKINWSSHGRKLTAREIFKRARPSYEGRLLGVIGDYHLNGMLQHPLLPSPADGRRDTVIVLDPTTCTGKYRKATRLALEGAEELALIASDAALQGSEKLFEEFFGTTDKSIRAKVAARFQSIAANAHVTSAGKKSPRIPIKYYCQGGPDYEFLTGRPDPCAAAPGAHAITRNSNHIVNCPMYYQHYDRFLRECPKPGQFRPDGRSVTLHELTHLDDAFHPDWEMFKKTTDYA